MTRTPLPPAGSKVFIIDDDAAVRASIADLLQSAGLPEYVRAWATVREYLSADPRPKDCRFRLMNTPGAAYPRSGCAACDWTPFRGTGCPHEKRTCSAPE